MNQNAARIFEEIRQLPVEDRQTLIFALIEGNVAAMTAAEVAAWQAEAGEPEPGYEEWVKESLEEALADDAPGIPHEEVVREVRERIRQIAAEKAFA